MKRSIKMVIEGQSGEIAGLDVLIFGTATTLVAASLIISVFRIVEAKVRLQELTDAVAREMVLRPTNAPQNESHYLADAYASQIGIPVGTWSLNTRQIGGACGAISVVASASTKVNLLYWPIQIGLPVALSSQSRIPIDAYRYQLVGGVSCVAP